jgi:transketolase
MQPEIIPFREFQRIQKLSIGNHLKWTLIADACRVNTLNAVKNAGSGHLGSSFSSMELVVWLYYQQMNIITEGIDSPNRDIYFSSKGHDVPGLYSVLFSLGILPEEKFVKLRRLGGLDGHPDVAINGIEANSGSLGMGISKAKGMAWAKQFLNQQGNIYVMTGDGEFQEGQNFEALQTCVQQHMNRLTVIMDHNKVQSDRPVEQIIALRNLPEKIRSFGWHVVEIDGHDFAEIEKAFTELKQITDKPKFIIAHTIKGKGVSFMEHPFAFRTGNGLYPWHAGAPDDQSFALAHTEILNRINIELQLFGFEPLSLTNMEKLKQTYKHIPLNALGEPISEAAIAKHSLKQNSEYVVEAFGKALVDQGEKRNDLVVIDADLSSDCRLRYFENRFPHRFIENGIAEQDMVSMAGGLARMGLLPVVNSFASFLASRANEQIYNNATEHTKIIYGCHYGGLIPAGPGKSHQSIRDISLLGALPNMEIIQPCNPAETEMVVDYCVNQAKVNCAIRMNISPSPRKIKLPEYYSLKRGRGIPLRGGSDALLFAYGPVMLNEALLASETLVGHNFGLEVVNMPWLNVVDMKWMESIINDHVNIFVLEDHATVGALGEFLLHKLSTDNLLDLKRFKIFGVEDYPACGTPQEALQYHKLDGLSLAKSILALCLHKTNSSAYPSQENKNSVLTVTL